MTSVCLSSAPIIFTRFVNAAPSTRCIMHVGVNFFSWHLRSHCTGSTALVGNAQSGFVWSEVGAASWGHVNPGEDLPPAGRRVDMSSRHVWINEWGWTLPSGELSIGGVPESGMKHSIEVVGVDGYDLSGFVLEFYSAGTYACLLAKSLTTPPPFFLFFFFPAFLPFFPIAWLQRL